MSKETLLPHRSFSTVLVVLVLLLGTLMAPVPYSSGEDSRAERTLYVDDDGTETYTSIQSAVNAASAGDTIVVRDGEYVENLVIGREITLRSDNGSAFTTIRAASSSNHCVQLLGDRTVLQGFTITGAADGYNSANVYINKASHCEILENDLRDSYHGAYLYYSDGYHTLRNNNFTGASYNGLYIYMSPRNTVEANNFSGNRRGVYGNGFEGSQNFIRENTFTNNDYGVLLTESCDLNTITNNSFQNNTDAGIDLYGSDSNILRDNHFQSGGIFLEEETTENEIASSNTVGGKPIYYYETKNGGTVPAGAGQVIINNCMNMVVQGQNCSGTEPGIMVRDSSYITIRDNVCSGRKGICVYESGYIDIINNSCQLPEGLVLGQYDNVIEIYSSSYVTVKDNNCTLEGGYGIFCLFMENSVIENNTCTSLEGAGLYLRYMGRSIVRNNRCEGGYTGIWLTSSDGNEIYNNSCSFNHKGMVLDGCYSNILRDNNCSSNTGTGLYVNVGGDNTVRNNSCSGNQDHGIYIHKGMNNEVSENHCQDNKDFSIYLHLAENTRVADNLCVGGYYNILIAEATDSTLTGNTLVDGGISFQGEEEGHWTSHSIDSSNGINGKPLFYASEEEGAAVPQGVGQVILAGCSDMEVTGQNLSNCSVGILLGFCSDITLRDNHCSYNNYGISVTASRRLVLENNRCDFNKAHGIMFWGSSSSELRENDCSDNNGAGIRIGGENFNNLFTENECSRNPVGGIHAEGSSKGLFLDNTCDSNGNGIYLGKGCEMNILSLNTLSKNQVGLALNGNRQSNNILGNNFQDNSRYGTEALGLPGFPHPLEHNYWGDSSGPYHPDLNALASGDPASDYLDFDPWLSEAASEDETREFLLGYVLDDNNRPLTGAKLLAEYQGGSAEAVSDGKGFYHITGLPFAEALQLTVELEGYRDFEVQLGTERDPAFNILMQSEFDGPVLFVKEGAGEGGDGSYQRPYATIMTAIDAAEEGTSIKVLDGYYREPLPIEKTVHLIGNGSATTTIHGGSATNVILLKTPGISIEGFTISADRSYIKGRGIYVMDQEGCRIENNRFSSRFLYGVHVYRGDNTIVSGNTVSNCKYGVYIYDSDYCEVTNNSCDENGLGSGYWNWDGGIKFTRSHYGVISDNKCENNIGSGIVLDSSHYNTLERNSCRYNDFAGVRCFDADGNSYKDNFFTSNVRGVHFLNSDNNSLEDNHFYSNQEGLVLEEADNNEIASNLFRGSYFGVLIQESYFDKLTANIFEGCGIVIKGNSHSQRAEHSISTSNTVGGNPIFYYGGKSGLTVPEGAGQVILADCDRMTVENQDCNNGSVGITLLHTDNSTVRNNSCRDNNYGISLEASNENILENNDCSFNKAYGTILWSSGSNQVTGSTLAINKAGGLRVGGSYAERNTITDNVISENGKDGARFEQASGNLLTGNTIHENKVGLRFFRGSDNNDAHDNSIVDNSEYGVLGSEGENTRLDAENNWWGHGSGPYHPEENPGGLGDLISGNVDFNPWLGKDVNPDDRFYVWVEADIGGNGSWEQPFRTIQDAIDAANEGQIIEIWEGTYTDPVMVDKPLDIQGNGSQQVTIEVESKEAAVAIVSNWVNLSGLRIRNLDTGEPKERVGVVIVGDHVTLRGVRVEENRDGIKLRGNENQIIDCDILGNDIGVQITPDLRGLNGIGIYPTFDISNNNLIQNCQVSGNGRGVWLDGSPDAGVSGNYCRGTSILETTISANQITGLTAVNSLDTRVWGCSITGNGGFGVENQRSLGMDQEQFGNELNASRNYWGSDSGPFHPKENPTGQGDAVSDNVVFRPWLNANGTENQDSKVTQPEEEAMNLFFYAGLGLMMVLLLLAGIGMAASELFRFQVFKLLFPLYTRLSGQDIEEDIRQHSIRGRIYQHILENPGSSFSDIVTLVSAGNGNTSYHLSVLEREGYIRSAANGRRKLFWMRREFPGTDEATLPPVQKEILNWLEQHGRLSRKALLERTGLSRATLHYNVKHLVRSGMVAEEKQGKEKICFLR